MNRIRLPRRWSTTWTLLLVLAVVATATAPAIGEREAQTRTVSQVYLATTDRDVDCETLWGGACFDLVGDELEAGISLVDDSGQRPTMARYEFRDDDGGVVADGSFCETTTAPVPPGASVLAVLVAAADVVVCGEPAIGTTGLIRVVTRVSDGAFGAYEVEPQECLQGVPHAISVGGLTEPEDTGQRVTLDTYVLLDGVSHQRGRQVMERAAVAFESLGIDLRAHYRPVSLPSTDMGQMLISHSMEAVGGEVPRGFDIVHTLTDKPLNVNGQASCVGGVRYRDRAFSVTNQASNVLVTAHEIGHTMGAHHHHGNCVEDPVVRGQEHCTVMVSGGTPPSLWAWDANFSSLNGAIVRAHAVRYASP